MKKAILILAWLALALPASAGDLAKQLRNKADQLRVIADKVQALEDAAPPVDPDPDPDPEPEPEPEPTGTLKTLAADPIVGTVTKPAKAGDSYTDPVYGLKITRASVEATHGRHEYSRKQAFNADSTRYLTWKSGYWYTHDAATMQPVRRLNYLAGDAEPSWSHVDPKKLLFTTQNGLGGVWWWLDVETNTRTVAFDLNGRSPFPQAKSYWTQAEGTTTADGSKIALSAETYTSGVGVKHYGMLVVDIATGNVLSSMAETDRPNFTAISPSGRYVLACWVGGKGIRSYKADFSSYKQIGKTCEHSDFAVGPNGRDDLYVFADFSTGYLRSVNLDTGEDFTITRLYPRSGSSYSLHVSGRGLNKPGWAVISTYLDNADYGRAYPDPVLQPEYRKVWLAELKPNGRKLSVAHIRTTGKTYFDEPQASANRDLSRIIFASNLGDGASDSYIVDLPQGWDR